MIRLRTKPKEICLINIHAPTENSDGVDKDEFYEEVTRFYDRVPENVIKIMLGDVNAKIGKELMFVPTIGLESVHEESNDNGQRIISFAVSRSSVVSSTAFPYKNIQKYTWKSPDRQTMNQIDHVLIAKRFRSSITDVRSYKGADCDTDHFLVICKFRLKLPRASRHFQKTLKFNIEELKDEEKRQKYITEITGKLNERQENERKVNWNTIKKTILEAVHSTLGEPKKRENKWFNSDCRKVVKKEVKLA